MNKRHEEVLKGLVAEYIATGEPVGSSNLVEALSLSVSPATMRHILVELEEQGYIVKPHTSAGRIPTDKGYRFYVNCLVAKDVTRRQRDKVVSELTQLRETYGGPSRATAKLLSHLAHALAVSGWMRAHDVHEAGLAQMVRQDDQDSTAAIQEISQLLDHVDAYLEQIALRNPTTTVYIGSENPLWDATHTSAIVRSVALPGGEQAVLLIIGKKRMPYQKNLALVNSVAAILEEGFD